MLEEGLSSKASNQYRCSKSSINPEFAENDFPEFIRKESLTVHQFFKQQIS